MVDDDRETGILPAEQNLAQSTLRNRPGGGLEAELRVVIAQA